MSTAVDDDTPGSSSRSLRRFAAPRFWPAWAILAWMKLMAVLPVGLALRIHRGVGKVMYRVLRRHRRTVLRNLELCFPELSPSEREALAKRNFESVAAYFAECAIGWFGSERHVEGLFDVRGIEHLQAGLAKGKGVILYTGHFTPVEICGRALKRSMPDFACLYAPRGNALIDEMQRRGRMRVAHESIPHDNIRMMLRSLRRNAAVWYAPDQYYEGGALVPFFGELAVTNAATSKLARMTGATIVPLSYRRLEGQARYEIRFHEPLADFPTDDEQADTCRLVRQLESFIRVCPEQYLWNHRRFKGRPEPLPNLYANLGKK
jgi:KDO2-lipid IV(A) lauroyltransferase